MITILKWLDDGRVQAKLNNKKYVRKEKRDIAGNRYIVINKSEYRI